MLQAFLPSARRGAAAVLLSGAVLGALAAAGCASLPVDPKREAARLAAAAPKAPPAARAEAAAALARRARALERAARAEEDPPELRLHRLAEAHLLAAAELQPQDAALQTALGDFYAREGHVEAALAAYDRALAVAAFEPRALLGAARLEVATGRERRAARHLEALRSLPEFPLEALRLEARVALTLERARDQTPASRRTYLERALRAFRELRERLPEDPRGTLGLAYCLARRILAGPEPAPAQVAEVRDLFLEASRRAPADPLPRYDLGRFLEARGDEVAARQQYRAALARDPRHTPSLLNLARLLLARGDAARAEALRLYRRVLPELRGPRRRRVERILAGAGPGRPPHMPMML